MHNQKTQGFTLIELLVVISILSVLAVALLATINPAEAQRKARDTQRLKDLSTLQLAISSYLNDNPGTATSATVNSGGNANKNCNNTGWLTIDVCNNLNRLPIDPQNRKITATNDQGADLAASDAYYYVRISNGDYHICSFLESKTNAKKLDDDGIVNNYYDVYSSLAVACP